MTENDPSLRQSSEPVSEPAPKPGTGKTAWNFRSLRGLVGLLIFVIALALLPAIQVRQAVGSAWHGVVPSIIDDDVYYYARIHEVLDGYPLIGNPYFFEHRNELSPAFFVADWLASIPYFILPFSIGVVANVVIWSVITTLLAYALIRRLGANGRWAIGGAGVFFVTSYLMLLRPTSMQIVLPALLVFWIAFNGWLREPTKLRSNVWLALATALQFYIYTYLWLVAGGTYLAMLLVAAWRHRWNDVLRLLACGLASILLAAPVLWLTYLQIRHPWYWETMFRVSLVETHVPPSFAFVLIGWIVVVIALWWMARRTKTIDHEDLATSYFIITIGAGMVMANLSPIVTGKEQAMPIHIFRFVMVWSVCVLCIALMRIRAQWLKQKIVPRIILIVLVCAAAYYPIRELGVIPTLVLPPDASVQAKAIDVQGYAAPAAWLEGHATGTVVIWADNALSAYLPILTRHYVLFQSYGTLHLLATREAEDRFLTSRYFEDPNASSLANAYRTYAGTGNAVEQPNTHNREVVLCRFFHLSVFGVACGIKVSSALEWKGSAYFDELEQRFKQQIAPDINSALQKYQVAYIVKDKLHDADWDMAKIPSASRVYDDGRFEIFQLTGLARTDL